MKTISKKESRPKESTRSESSDCLNRWAVILAGGDGTRLRSFTRTITGDERPKQFCPIVYGRTLLDQTRDRVATSVSEDQTLLVLTESHEPYYKQLTTNLSRDLLLIQPENKGTAAAIIYALMRIAWKSPGATVAIFPSDHYFSDDATFMSHVESAFDASLTTPAIVTLLGITPENPEVEYGWIEPQTSILEKLPRAISRVRRFWEKPSANLASRLMKQGCLWNSFVMVGRVDAFLRMARRTLPELCDFFAAIVPSFETPAESSQLRELYSWIPSTNFSQEVLAMRPDDLAVMRVEKVGWSDLGEPSRVLTTLARLGVEAQLAASA
ncbi:MAG TPA: sugar phosphate nucleotidyltransferase [Pyrinomonadaceae bacterium]|jgi:mannose-1-phosphate guanylyltransferase